MSMQRYGRQGLGLRPIINVSGTMTALGASIMVPDAIAAMTAIAPEFIEMSELHRLASEAIVLATGAEAGFVTASAAAGIVIAVAAAMTGTSQRAIEGLPLDAVGLKTQFVLQHGHDVNYGNSISQAVRMAGGRPILVGSISHVSPHQIEDAIDGTVAAGVFVVAHTTSRCGMVGLREFSAICHGHDVPVIVDAASEYDLKRFLADGADLVIYSGHKFLGGPTTGIIAGRRDLIEACRRQNSGIGRAMKVGKESIVGLIAALDAWQRRDHGAIRQQERAALDMWKRSLADTAWTGSKYRSIQKVAPLPAKSRRPWRCIARP
jgi:L-seryl-tRNA(Ser) seleniumtransferase